MIKSRFQNPAKTKWIAGFDMENLIGSILRNGMVISVSLVLAGLAIGWAQRSQASFGESVRAVSIPVLLLMDLQRLEQPGEWPAVFMHLGLSALLITPYVRVAASLWYFAAVERDLRQTLFTGFVLIILTITLFTNWI